MTDPGRSEPRRVFLFSGHMIDRVDRREPRFPAEREGAVAVRLFELLESLDAGPGDLGICGGAGGGDVIFAEACLGRGLEVEVLLPQAEDTFLAVSVDPSGTGWRERFRDVVGAEAVRTEVMDETYSSAEGLGLYSRHGRWLIERALAWGAERLIVIALWDGQPSGGSGGTAEVIEAARHHTDRVHIIRPDV